MQPTSYSEFQTQNFLQLEGLTGLFKTPNSKFQVRFFSTYANRHEPQYSRFLDELKPMRERITIDQIKNISQVLQRDLDDFRISEGLIPYLLNKINGISDPMHLAFFPAILGVIIPKNYLTQNSDTINDSPTLNSFYPEASTNIKDEVQVINYRIPNSDIDSWRVKQRLRGNSVSPCALIEIDTNLSEILVLDGQHRANAFRVATDTFFTNPNNRIYEPFYDRGEIFDSEIKTNLPVTLICFESIDNSTQVVPDLISRKLFIDVNNNAKPISSSRKILLDDRDPSSIITNCFYTLMAERTGFATASSELSLIHLGFDTNHSMRQRKKDNILNITNPEVLNVVFDWYFFGSRVYNTDLDKYSVQRELLRFNQPVLQKLLPDSSNAFYTTQNEEGDDIKIITAVSELPKILLEFRSRHIDAFCIILNGIHFLRDHYAAVTEIQNRRNNSSWASNTKKEVWDEIFIGGEGLFFSYEKLFAASRSLSPALQDKRDAIDEIENEFRLYRSTLLGASVEDSSSLYESFSTLAFQVALFMAYYDFASYYSRIQSRSLYNPDFQRDIAKLFIHRINSIDKHVWIKMFTSVRPLLWDRIDPKKWPTYHKLILRFINDPDAPEFYITQSNFDVSPEAKIFKIKFERKVRAYLSQKYTTRQLADKVISAVDFASQNAKAINRWKSECFDEVNSLFVNDLGFALLNFNQQAISTDVINEIL